MSGKVATTVRTALRALRRQPGFSLLAVLTLAVGIGPTTAVYAVFRQVLLRELPVPNPQQLVLLQEHSAFETGSLHTHGGPAEDYFAYPAYLAFRRAQPALAAIAADPTTLVTKTIAERVNANLVTGNYFSVLDVRPVLGRLLNEDDNRIHAGRAVAVLSESYWRRSFSASPSVLGSVVRLNGAPFVVVGVAAYSSLMDANLTQVFVPIAEHSVLSVGRADTLDDPLYRFVAIVGRNSSGKSRQALEAKLNSVWWNWRRDVLHAHAGDIGDAHGWMQTHLSAVDGSRGISILSEDFGAPVLALQAMTALVLLVACSNLASLLLARGTRRRGELAVRLALGSGRSKIITATVAEAMLLGLGGAVFGLPLGWLSLRLLSYAVSTESSIGAVLQAAWQWPVAGFAIVAALVTSILFSAGPALAAARVRPAEVLRHSGGPAGSAGARMQRILASGSIALSLLLLAGAVLLGWNLYRQSTVQFGFGTQHILSFSVNESATGATPVRTDQVYSAILAGAQARPGVNAAAYAEAGLLTGDDWDANITVEGRKNLRTDPDVQKNYVTDAFFSLFNIPIVHGRDFASEDAPNGEQVAVVNQAFVRKFFAGNAAQAVGGHFGFGYHGSKMRFPLRIIGVVPSFYAQAPDAPIAPASAYMLYRQSYAANSAADASTNTNYPATFYMRTVGDPRLLAADMRALVHRVDPQLPMTHLLTMQQQVSEDIADIRLMALLSFGLGGLAVLLAAVGLYGVLAYQIATRTREIGVRMAVGASRANVALLVFKDVCRLTFFGVGAGTLIAFGAAHLLHAEIADLQQAPVWLYSLAGLLLLTAALMAAILPAQRASHVEPMEALRTE